MQLGMCITVDAHIIHWTSPRTVERLPDAQSFKQPLRTAAHGIHAAIACRGIRREGGWRARQQGNAQSSARKRQRRRFADNAAAHHRRIEYTVEIAHRDDSPLITSITL